MSNVICPYVKGVESTVMILYTDSKNKLYDCSVNYSIPAGTVS